jgi:peptidoglycan/LPS O-acetylase OafA/YrhL
VKYRREIDGLRAVAVLPVILFHAGFSAFSGGFIGVDVFFVISGYLITTIILAEKEKGTFSLATFYERRARRILPALFFVMLCCFPFAWLWLLPSHLEDFSKSLIAVSAFSSNILFWQESGYFATAAELKPLLHTWSLAVEEQYYVLFPLFLMLMWKLRKRWILGSLVVIAMASLALAQWGAYSQPSATFFLLPTRAWELAIGALIAFYFLYRKNHVDFITANKTISETLGILGIVLICYSIIVFDKSTPFPSFYALIPTIGTGLIIVFTTPQTLVGRLLGTKKLLIVKKYLT